MMYFDEIVIYKKKPKLNHVSVYCAECGENDIVELMEVERYIDGEYVTLKDGIILKCEKCGVEHTDRKILYKPKDHYTTVNIPRCPICQSTNLKKITVGSKLLAAGMVGVFAAPYTSKTYECMNCHAKF